MERWKRLVIAAALCEAAGLPGIPPTRRAIEDGWYDALRMPGFTPPKAVFGPAWGVLYALQGVTLERLWAQRRTSEGRRALNAFAVQLLLNAAWSPVFFGGRAPRAGLVVVLGMLAGVTNATVRAGRVERSAALPMLPYVAWVAFATALNAGIVRLNPRVPAPRAPQRERPGGSLRRAVASSVGREGGSSGPGSIVRRLAPGVAQ